MKLLYLSTGCLVGLVSGGFVMWFLTSPWIEAPRVNYQTLGFAELNSKIYMSARVWGLTGDYEEVRMCTTPIDFQESAKSDCMVFYTDEMLYRKVGSNKLSVSVVSSSVPKNQAKKLGPIEIEIHELSDSDRLTDFSLNCEKYGLLSIAAP